VSADTGVGMSKFWTPKSTAVDSQSRENHSDCSSSLTKLLRCHDNESFWDPLMFFFLSVIWSIPYDSQRWLGSGPNMSCRTLTHSHALGSSQFGPKIDALPAKVSPKIGPGSSQGGPPIRIIRSQVGDLHGQYWDFMNVLSMVGPPQQTFGQLMFGCFLEIKFIHLG